MQKLPIPSTSDSTLIECFSNVPTLESFKYTLRIGLVGTNTYIDNLEPEKLKTDAIIQKLIAAQGNTIYHITLSVGTYIVNYHRGGDTEPKSAYLDVLVFSENSSSHQKTISINSRVELSQYFTKQLRRFDPTVAVHPALTKEQADLATAHSAILTRLEALSGQLMQESHAYRQSVDLEFTQREQGRIEELQQQKTQLEEKFDTKHKAVEAEKSRLEKLKEELDDKSNTHARRQIRQDILGEIKKRQTEFSLTKGTNRLRTPIMVAMLLLTLFFGILTYLSATNFYSIVQGNDTNMIIVAAIKQVLYSIGTVGSIIFFIRWQNRWSEQHSNAEFQLKQFELDMERASWLVETSLEWKDAKGTAIPPELLNSLSRNLFTHKDAETDPLVHPVDQLASALLGSAAAIKLQAGNAMIDLDPKKLSKAKTTVPTTTGDKTN